MSDTGAPVGNPFVARHAADGFADLEEADAQRRSGGDQNSRGMAPATVQYVNRVRRTAGLGEMGSNVKAVDLSGSSAPVIEADDETDTGTEPVEQVSGEEMFADYGYSQIDWYARFAEDEDTSDDEAGPGAQRPGQATGVETMDNETMTTDGLPPRVTDVVSRFRRLGRVDRMLVREYLGLVPRSELRREVNRITAMAVADARESDAAALDQAADSRVAGLQDQLEQARNEIHRLERTLFDRTETAAGHEASRQAFSTDSAQAGTTAAPSSPVPGVDDEVIDVEDEADDPEIDDDFGEDDVLESEDGDDEDDDAVLDEEVFGTEPPEEISTEQEEAELEALDDTDEVDLDSIPDDEPLPDVPD